METIRLANIAAVTFDFFNTLVYHRTGRGRGEMLMEYLTEQGLRSDPWEHQVLYDVFEPHGVEYVPDGSPAEKRRYFERLANRVFQRLRVRGPNDAAADHSANIWRILGPASFAVFPEVYDVLRPLREAGYPLAVVSNWQCGLEHFCSELGLDDAFDHVLASAEVGSAKPDSGIFTEACHRLGVPAHRVLHVGDNPIEDGEGARAGGLQVVLVRRERHLGDRPSPSIPDLKPLPSILGLG